MEEKKKDEYWIAPIIKEQLDKVKKRVLTKDRDFVFVIDGEEGSGKSVLGLQLAKYLDPEFNLDKVVFNSDSFLKIIKDPKTKKGACIVLDEAYNAASARGSLSEINRAMIGVATEMRQKNLFVIMILPTFFDLDKYFALWRCRALFHCYFTENEDRRYLLFPKDSKKLLYLTGKKLYSYSKPPCPYPPFSFPHYYTVDETEYRKKKAEAFRRRTISNQARNWMLQRNAYIKYIIKNRNITQEEVAKIPGLFGALPLSNQSMSFIMKEIIEDPQDLG